MRELRKAKRTEEIAVELGISASTVYLWDHKIPQRTPLEWVAIMKAYGCTWEDLIKSEVAINESKSREKATA